MFVSILMQGSAIVNGKSIYMDYTAPERVFDLHLPDVLKLIQSLKIK